MIGGLFTGLARQLWRLVRTVLADVALAAATVLLLVALPFLILTAFFAAFAFLQRPTAGRQETSPARAALTVLTALIGLAAALREKTPTSTP